MTEIFYSVGTSVSSWTDGPIRVIVRFERIKGRLYEPELIKLMSKLLLDLGKKIY